MNPKPVITAKEAAGKVKDGDTVMIGGFMASGSPHTIIAALTKFGPKNLTLVCNDTATHNTKSGQITGVAHLVANRQFAIVRTSHIGLNQETQRQMNAGEIEVELIPQGTLAERIRAAGAGLGGFLTPTGVGTEVQDGKDIITVGGRDYLLELPLAAEVALIKAKRADRSGNLVYAGTAQNFNPLMATAARVVIAEVEELVEIGDLDPAQVRTPSIFVDYLVTAETLDM